MRRGVLGILCVLSAMLGVVGYNHAPASALSLFGFEVTLAGPPQTKTLTKFKTSNDDQTNTANDASSVLPNNNCVQYTTAAYEVCIAYLFNASLADAVPYYQYVKSSNNALADFVSNRLETEYSGQAVDVLKARVATWPKGDMEVSIPNIKILSLAADAAGNTALLSTQESWLVKTKTGHILFKETEARRVITLQRMPSQSVDNWVVVRMQ